MEEHFLKYVKKTNSCWVWIGHFSSGINNQSSYGRLSFSVDGKRKKVYAHRYSYEIYKGEIPKGMVIDHSCRNRRCVNPAHLEAVEAKENNRRKHRFCKACREKMAKLRLECFNSHKK